MWYIPSLRVSVTLEFCSRIKAFHIRKVENGKDRDEIKRQDDQKHLSILAPGTSRIKRDIQLATYIPTNTSKHLYAWLVLFVSSTQINIS